MLNECLENVNIEDERKRIWSKIVIFKEIENKNIVLILYGAQLPGKLCHKKRHQ